MGSSLSVFCQSFSAISKFFQYLPKVLLFVLSVPYNHVLCYHLLLHCGQSLLAFVRSVKQSWRKSGARRTHRAGGRICARYRNYYGKRDETRLCGCRDKAASTRCPCFRHYFLLSPFYTSRPCFPALLARTGFGSLSQSMHCIIME